MMTASHSNAPQVRRVPFEKRMTIYDHVADEYRMDAVFSVVKAYGRETAAELINAVLNGEISPADLRQAVIAVLVKQKLK